MQSNTTDTPNETNMEAIKELNTNPCLVLFISPNTNLHWLSLMKGQNSYGVNRTIYDFKNETIFTFNICNIKNRSQRRLNKKDKSAGPWLKTFPIGISRFGSLSRLPLSACRGTAEYYFKMITNCFSSRQRTAMLISAV